jgi:hypothetical protein
VRRLGSWPGQGAYRDASIRGPCETLQLEVERSRAARLRAWAVLGELRAILTGAGQELLKPAEKSFVKEGEILRAGAQTGPC